jgi:hypothetical protein
MNFGVPKELLEDETSVLYELTKKLSPNEKKLIYETAQASSPKPFQQQSRGNKLRSYEDLTMLPSSGGYINKAAVIDEDEFENVESVRF